MRCGQCTDIYCPHRHTDAKCYYEIYEEPESQQIQGVVINAQLTWKDIEKIEDIMQGLHARASQGGKVVITHRPDFYEEVAKQFNQYKQSK